MIKVNGTRRLTLRNRRFVRELDPRKTSLEDQHFEPNTEPPSVPITGKKEEDEQDSSCQDANHMETDTGIPKHFPHIQCLRCHPRRLQTVQHLLTPGQHSGDTVMSTQPRQAAQLMDTLTGPSRNKFLKIECTVVARIVEKDVIL